LVSELARKEEGGKPVFPKAPGGRSAQTCKKKGGGTDRGGKNRGKRDGVKTRLTPFLLFGGERLRGRPQVRKGGPKKKRKTILGEGGGASVKNNRHQQQLKKGLWPGKTGKGKNDGGPVGGVRS